MAQKQQSPTPPRRPAPASFADFDEQLWPVNLLLFLFAACVAAVIIVKSDFATPKLLANGWCHLGALAAIVGTLALGVVRLDRRVQRRMQLGVFLSLLVHLWLCMLSYNIYLSAIAQREKDAPEAFEEPAPVTLPDYNWQDQATDDATDPTLETPVDTSLPESEQEVERSEPLEQPQERPAEPEPEVRPVQPTTSAIERTEMSAPRRADELAGQISRQERRAADTNEQAAIPKVDEARESAIESAVRVERMETQVEQSRVATETTLPTSEPAAQSLVRQPTRDNPSASMAMNLPRNQQAAAVNSPSRLSTERISESANASRISAAATQVERSDSAVRMARRTQPMRETPSVSIDVAANQTPRTSSAAQPRIDSRTDSKLARTATSSESARATVATPRIQAAAEAASEVRETQVAQLTRARATLPDAVSQAADVSESLATAPSASASADRSGPAPRVTDEQPSISPSSSSVASRQRSKAIGIEAAVAESAALSSEAAPGQQAAQPSSADLNKASGGVAGLTRQQNFDSELPGMSTAATAQSAARRPEAMQAMDAGNASAPSAPAQIARARVAADAPSASMRADDVTVADVAGSARPAETEASSSAAVARLAAAAPRAQRTAAAGAGSIDQGAPQIRSPIGEGRTSGGGEPSLASNNRAPSLAKASPAAGASGANARVAAEIPGGAATGDRSSEPAPAIAAVGRSDAGSPSVAMSGATTSSSEGSEAPTAIAMVEARRSESSPDVGAISTGTPTGRSRGELASVDGQVETDALAQMAAVASSSRGEPGDSEPASASDVVRETPAGLPVGDSPADADSVGPIATGAAAIGQLSTSRSDAAPAIVDGGTIGLARALSASAAPAVDATVTDDLSGSIARGSARGELTAKADIGPERQAAALPVLAAAPVGAGGLSSEPAFDVGVPSRRARPESDMAHLSSGRLILQRSGANRAAEVRVQDVAVPGFRQRDRQLREELARQRGGSEGSERAVEMGLDFLARHQNVDGSWSLQKFSQGRPGYEYAGDGQMVSDTAATGLSMLAFLGAGYTHTDGKYRLVVARGLNFLLGNQRADGDLFLPQEAKSNVNVWLYSHGIASIALCEAYGMTRDPNLRQPAQRALDFIVASQHPTEGGWRYAPRQGSDTSVSGWQLMALKSGELAGLRVPAATYAKVGQWLDGARAKTDQARYVYRPKSTKEHQTSASRVMTAEALLMRQYLGWKRDNPLMIAGADHLMKELPEWSIKPDWQRDSYYWYYATQVMFQMGGPHWDAWNDRLRPLLVEKQVSEGPLAGSWEPLGDVPDRWGREGGRIYVTAMHLLMLEVYYRHLPLYRTLDE